MRGCLGQTLGRRSSGSSESARVRSNLTARRQSKGMCLRVVQSIVTCQVCLWSRRQPKGIYPRAAQSVVTCHCAGGIRRGIRRSQQTEARERHTLSLAMWPRSTVLVGLGVMTPRPRGGVGNAAPPDFTPRPIWCPHLTGPFIARVIRWNTMQDFISCVQEPRRIRRLWLKTH